MEEFGLDIQKHVSLKQTKIYLSKNKKNIAKTKVLKGNFKYNDAVCLTGYSL